MKLRQWRRLGRVAGLLLASAASQPDVGAREWVPATDPRIHYSDGLQVQRDEAEGVVRFDRVIDGPGRGFRWDAPGARVRWRTNSTEVRVHLRFSAGHTGSSRNSIGAYRIDGRGNPAWRFSRPAAGAPEVMLPLPAPADGAAHNYELILPYGDSIDVLGVEAAPGAAWEPPPARPPTRYVAFGDSVTHGFTAATIEGTYAFQVAERNGWELINLGIGGRGTHGPDGEFLAGVEADVISVLIGVNDWQAGAELESFRRQYDQLLAGLRAGHPDTPVYVITPLWVAPSWRPAAAKYPLERYREVIREVAAARRDEQLHVLEGPTLIDPDPARFDAVAVHPNDAGFSQLAARLAAAMQPRP